MRRETLQHEGRYYQTVKKTGGPSRIFRLHIFLR